MAPLLSRPDPGPDVAYLDLPQFACRGRLGGHVRPGLFEIGHVRQGRGHHLRAAEGARERVEIQRVVVNLLWLLRVVSQEELQIGCYPTWGG